ncbi:hypothetical protein F4780DRAFT_76447 [Xylariomycetidae sp. FL0641]|nr:hypothetical protein F4780DRAFT_76447 [Xylariomycetidae sp. FL0641]
MRCVHDERNVERGESKKSMQVIAAGLPRCATSSLQAALESEWLDCGPAIHMAHIMPWADREQLAIDAMKEDDREKRHKLLYELYDGYGATCDFPGCVFTDDLMDMFPDAKVILNQRKDAETWATSVTDALMWFCSWRCRVATFLFKTDRLHTQMQLTAFQFHDRKLGVASDPRDPATLRAWYAEYNAWVRAEAARRGRPLLEWQPQDGWAPLCAFLGKPAPPPHVSFPRTNDQAELGRLKTYLVVRGLTAWAALLATAYVGLRYGPKLLAGACGYASGRF